MSKIDYIKEKIAEDRHNEIVSIIIFAIGFLPVLLGFYMALQEKITYEHHLFYTIKITTYPLAEIGIIIVILGVILMLTGAVTAVYYGYQRSKNMAKLEVLTEQKT